jgi:hypothetical protein
MDITKILEELRREHEQLGEAILSLERLAAGGKRRGRPPAWLAAAQQSTPPRTVAKPVATRTTRKTKKRSAPSDSSDN